MYILLLPSYFIEILKWVRVPMAIMKEIKYNTLKQLARKLREKPI